MFEAVDEQDAVNAEIRQRQAMGLRNTAQGFVAGWRVALGNLWQNRQAVGGAGVPKIEIGVGMTKAEQGLAGEMRPNAAELRAQQSSGDGAERGAVEIIEFGTIWRHGLRLS